MQSVRSIVAASFTALASLAAVACASGDSVTAPASTLTKSADDGGPSIAATLRLRCELRVGKSSRISVDGSGVAPLNGMFRAGVRSGGNVVTHPAKQAILNQVEFDFSSDPNDIAAGAQPIPANYIVVSPTGPDVIARIVDASGATVVQGGADCRVR